MSQKESGKGDCYGRKYPPMGNFGDGRKGFGIYGTKKRVRYVPKKEVWEVWSIDKKGWYPKRHPAKTEYIISYIPQTNHPIHKER